MEGRRVTYSNVMSTLAVVIALTGGSVAIAAIGKNDVGSKQVDNESLKSKDLKDGKAVGSSDVIDGSLTGVDVADGSLAGVDVTDGTVDAADIANNAVTGAKIANGAVNGTDVADGTLGGADVADGGIAGADVADGGLSGADIADGGLAGADIADASVTGTDIDENSLGTIPYTTVGTAPYAVVTGTTAETFPDGSTQAFKLDTIVSRSNMGFNNALDLLTVNVAGTYLVSGFARWETNGAGRRELRIGREPPFGQFFPGITIPAVNGDASQLTTTWVDRFEAGDNILLLGQQTSGGDLDTEVRTDRGAMLSAVWLGP